MGEMGGVCCMGEKGNIAFYSTWKRKPKKMVGYPLSHLVCFSCLARFGGNYSRRPLQIASYCWVGSGRV